MRRLLHLGVLAVALATGCATPLESITDVIKPRVIGVVVRVQGDPTRASPAPGETMEVELVVADPGRKKGRSFVFVACAPSDSTLDIGSCETFVGGPFLSPPLPGEGDPKPSPTFTMQIPDEATLGDATELLVIGGVCADGELDAAFDPDAFQGGATSANPCADKEKQGQLLTIRIPLERVPEDRNHSPYFASILFDGVSWTESALETDMFEGCAGGPLPQKVHTGAEIPIDMTLTAESRELYLNDEDPREEVLEEPFVAFHGTGGGDFAGAYSFFDDTPLVPTLKWTMPARGAVPENGLLVRFYFVLRDGRGGSSFVERAICIVLPPAP